MSGYTYFDSRHVASEGSLGRASNAADPICTCGRTSPVGTSRQNICAKHSGEQSEMPLDPSWAGCEPGCEPGYSPQYSHHPHVTLRTDLYPSSQSSQVPSMTQLSTQSSLSGAVSGSPGMSQYYDRSSDPNPGFHDMSMMHVPPMQHMTPSPRTATGRQIMLEQADQSQTTISHQSPSSSAPESSSAQDGEQHDDRRRFPCMYPECDRRFVSDYTLRVHMAAHKAKPRVRYPCTAGCAESFSRQHDRLRHEVGQHGKICEFICDDCGCFFSTKKTFNNHKCPVASGKVRWAQ